MGDQDVARLVQEADRVDWVRESDLAHETFLERPQFNTPASVTRDDQLDVPA